MIHPAANALGSRYLVITLYIPLYIPVYPSYIASPMSTTVPGIRRTGTLQMSVHSLIGYT